jgi:hypothetical protein
MAPPSLSFSGTNGRAREFGRRTKFRGDLMPIILWLLGVPLSIILLLMLFGVVSF